MLLEDRLDRLDDEGAWEIPIGKTTWRRDVPSKNLNFKDIKNDRLTLGLFGLFGVNWQSCYDSTLKS